MKVLYRDKSEQHELTVYDTRRLYGEQGQFRVLQFSDDAVQGALDLERPSRIVLEYPRAMLHLMERNDPQYNRVFVVGHGIGTIPSYLADRQVKVAELDAEVVRLSQHFFGYTGPDVRIGMVANCWSRKSPEHMIMLSLMLFLQLAHQSSLRINLFAMVKGKLDADGAVLLNVFGRSGNDKLVNAIYTTLGTQFNYTRAFALPTEPNEVQNRILIGSHRPIDVHIKQMAGFVEQRLEEGHIIEG